MPEKAKRGAEATSQTNSTKRKKPTQEDKVLDYIKKHGSITSWEAFMNLNITRLSGRIYDLREQGYDIDMNYETSANGTRWGVYTLKEGNNEIATSR